MVDQVMEYFGFTVNTIDSFLVSVVQQAKIGSEEISGKQGKNFFLLKDREK